MQLPGGHRLGVPTQSPEEGSPGGPGRDREAERQESERDSETGKRASDLFPSRCRADGGAADAALVAEGAAGRDGARRGGGEGQRDR